MESDKIQQDQQPQHGEKQRWFGLRGNSLVVWITIACATDMALFGYDQGVFSGVVLSQDYLDVMDLNGEEKTNLKAIITSIYDIGCFLGALFSFCYGQRLGRKRSILWGTAIMTVGAILQMSAFSVPHMIVGRVLGGIGNGINTATAPVWQTETAPAKYRGKLVVLELTANIAGFMVVSWINYGLSFAGGAIAWRLPVALQMIFIFVLFATVPWLPESPRWLIAQDRKEEAVIILADLQDAGLKDPSVMAETEEIEYTVRYEIENAERWRDLFRGRDMAGTKTLRRLFLGMGTAAMQQLGGINVLGYYLPTLLVESVGLSETMARLISACASVVYLLAAIGSVPLVERFGRRIMMATSAAISLVCFLAITILIYLSEQTGWSGAQKAAEASVAFFFLYYIGYSLGMLGTPWLYPTEINSLPMRTKGAAAATMTNWLLNFVVVEVTPIGIQSIKWKFYIIWTIANAIFLPVIWFFYPETADRTLEDLDAYYRESPSLIVVGDPTATSRRRPKKYADMQEVDVKAAEKEQAAHVEHVA